MLLLLSFYFIDIPFYFLCDFGFSVADNGSADLRSPEKEVYFRSWDLANS